VNGYPPIPPEAMDESGNPLKKKRREFKKKKISQEDDFNSNGGRS